MIRLNQFIVSIILLSLFGFSSAHADVFNAYDLTYAIQRAQNVGFHKGGIYYLSNITTPDKITLYRYDINIKQEFITTVFSAEKSSPIVISDSGVICFLSLSGEDVYLHSINIEENTNIKVYLSRCFSEQLYSPIIIENKYLLIQTLCSNLFVTDIQGKKITSISLSGTLVRPPIKTEKYIFLTMSDEEVFIVNLSELFSSLKVNPSRVISRGEQHRHQIATPKGLVPEDPPDRTAP